MNIITADAETYFDSDYSLKRLTVEHYVRDPRFAVHGWAIRWPDGASEWLTHEQAVERFKQVDWSKTAVLAHHSHFDLFILSHHYGIKPHAILCSLSMARLLLGNHLSVGLESLARHFGLSAKNVPYDLFKGKRWAELSPDVQMAVSRGALHDVELTWTIFNKFMTGDY